MPASAKDAQPSLGLHVLLCIDRPDIISNMTDNLLQGTIHVVQIVARLKPRQGRYPSPAIHQRDGKIRQPSCSVAEASAT